MKFHLVTPKVPALAGCRSTHPLSRERCARVITCDGPHWTEDPGGMWYSDTGKTSTPAGFVYVSLFGVFVPHPGHEADTELEHFPTPEILRHELASRVQHGWGTSFAPDARGATLRYSEVSRHAYMDVWMCISPDFRVTDPVPGLADLPYERWTVDHNLESQRTEYLPTICNHRRTA